jgi:hypothetical protein
VKAGWIVASAVDGAAVVIGHLPAGLEPGKLGQFRSQRLNGNPNVSRPPASRYATNQRVPDHGSSPKKCSRPPNRNVYRFNRHCWFLPHVSAVRAHSVAG